MSMTQHTYGVLFAGLGGLSLGFKRAGFTQAFAIDFDQAACADHEIITGETAICADLSTMTPAELRAISPRRPDVLVSSPPCVAFSGCLPAAQAKTPEYQAISSLAFGGVWSAIDAWRDSPPPLFVIENVPRITSSRGRAWLDDLAALFRDAGYAWAETTHDCGELGGLGQRRKRFLGVARHREQIRVYLYEPPRQRVRGCGEILEQLPCPVPCSDAGGAMHKVPRQSALNALRLALIPAGGDWRDLPEQVQMVFKPRSGVCGVVGWESTAGTVVGSASTDTGAYAVADPRSVCDRREGSLGVTSWEDATHAIIGRSFLQNTGLQVADPRVAYRSGRQNGCYGVNAWADGSHAVIGTAKVDVSWSSVQDTRLNSERRRGALHMTGWAEPSHTIIGATTGGGKAPNVADPRVPQIVGETPFDVADKAPRHWVIEAADGTWHRPMTTLELAALQGLPTTCADGSPLVLTGRNQGDWRKRIGNAVPPPAAEAIAKSCLWTLTNNGKWILSPDPIWVGPAYALQTTSEVV
jgi:site-specific DNA-cytosine methylase